MDTNKSRREFYLEQIKNLKQEQSEAGLNHAFAVDSLEEYPKLIEKCTKQIEFMKKHRDEMIDCGGTADADIKLIEKRRKQNKKSLERTELMIEHHILYGSAYYDKRIAHFEKVLELYPEEDN